MKKYLNNDRGAALLITLALMALLTGVALMSVNRSTTDAELSFNQVNEDQAFYVAEAGVKKAFVELNATSTWRGGYDHESYGNGAYSVMLIDSLSDTTLFDTVVIVSTGSVEGGVAVIEVEAIPEYIYPWKYAMFAEGGIFLDQTTCTDSYNSDSGTYVETYLDSLGSIGSNGTIGTSKDVTIGGDVQVATEGGINLGRGAIVTGDTTSTMDSVSLDIIPDEEYIWASTYNNNTLGMTGSGFSYDSGTKELVGGAGSNIVLESGVYYFSSISLGQNSTISLAPDANVKIYVDGDIKFDQYSTVNSGGTPSDLLVFSKSGSLTFSQYNEFTGAFYGNNSHVQYDQTTAVYGSIVGGTIQLDKGACFHYDRDLAKIQFGTTGRMIFSSWGEAY